MTDNTPRQPQTERAMRPVIFLLVAGWLLLAASFAGQAQPQTEIRPAYSVPFASRGNLIELEVVNPPSARATAGRYRRQLQDVVIQVNSIPEWIELTPTTFSLGTLAAGKQSTATFTFGVKDRAPVGEKASLRFTARSAGGVRWVKSIDLNVEAPTKFEVDPNYPNPFNPSTTIRYRLPAAMKVTVSVYNLLGRRVATLADGVRQAPGTRTLRFDGSRLASGLYFYRIVAEAEDGRQIVRHRKMLLIK